MVNLLTVTAKTTRFKLFFPILLAISIGCILGVENLAGLPNPPMPSLGTYDPLPA